jgi:hypothetical protein
MSKIKEAKLNNLTKEEMDNVIYEIPPMEYLDLMDEYNTGKYSHLNPNSENFDEVLDKANPNYSEYSVTDAVDYAFEVMQVTEAEVGKDVYKELIKEQIIAFIRSSRF